MTDLERKLFYLIQEQGESCKVFNKDCKKLKIGNQCLYAYHVQCEYIIGKDKNGEWIIDVQDEPALYLGK